MSRLLVAISAHGLGHLGQAAPVCNALKSLCPELRLTIWSALPLQTLQARITADFEHIEHPCDLGLIMHDAMRVDIPASWAVYVCRDADWLRRLDDACQCIQTVNPDLILSDVGDMPLAAAQALGIPNISMSSLNWADTARFYFNALPDATTVLDRLTAIYDNVSLALRLTPGMPMRGREEKTLPPVGAISKHTRSHLDATLGPLIDPTLRDRPKILIGMGGIETHLDCSAWPAQTAFTYIMANQPGLPAHGLTTSGIVNADALCAQTGLVFTDLLQYCDAVICKPGYGTFVEAALAAVPVLYVAREDWPEQRVLIEWLEAAARCAQIDAATLQTGQFFDHITALLAQPGKAPIRHDGAVIAAEEILAYLSRCT